MQETYHVSKDAIQALMKLSLPLPLIFPVCQCSSELDEVEVTSKDDMLIRNILSTMKIHQSSRSLIYHSVDYKNICKMLGISLSNTMQYTFNVSYAI